MLPLYQNIKNLREKNGISQQELANQTGYTSRSSIAKIEDGKVDLPQSKIELFAKALDTTPQALLGWENHEHYHSQWGNDNANRKHLENKPELLEIYEDIKSRDEIHILFDKVKDLDPKDVESVLLFIKTIRNERGLEE